MTIDSDIDALAGHIAQEATKTGDGAPPFEEKIEALKILTAYRAMVLKRKLGDSDPDEDVPNFENFGRDIQEAEADAPTKVRSGRGRRAGLDG